MDSFRKIIGAWPSDTALGDDLGIPASHVRTMRARDSIPSTYWTPLVAAAEPRGIKGITIERLAELKAVDPTPEPQPKMKEAV